MWKTLLIVGGMIIVPIFAVILAKGSGSEKYEYQRSLEAQLKDPSSAEYRNDSMYQGDDAKKYYCGEINAKNGFGGYTGFVRFMGAKGLFIFENGSEDDKMMIELLWPKNCAERID